MIEGTAGVGKTSFVNRLKACLAAGGVWIHDQPIRLTSETTLAGFVADVLRTLLSIHSSGTARSSSPDRAASDAEAALWGKIAGSPRANSCTAAARWPRSRRRRASRTSRPGHRRPVLRRGAERRRGAGPRERGRTRAPQGRQHEMLDWSLNADVVRRGVARDGDDKLGICSREIPHRAPSASTFPFSSLNLPPGLVVFWLTFTCMLPRANLAFAAGVGRIDCDSRSRHCGP